MNEGTNRDRSPNVDVRRNAGIVRSPLDEIKAIQTLLADVYKDAGDGRTLFRELVQNADDAGARRLRLTILDRRLARRAKQPPPRPGATGGEQRAVP